MTQYIVSFAYGVVVGIVLCVTVALGLLARKPKQDPLEDYFREEMGI